MNRAESITGAILGCAAGDALGLPFEGLTKRRGGRLLGQPERHRFVAGRGMVSDDTEHTWMVAQSLCAAPRDADAFARQFGGRLRWWLLGLPAGIGLGTLRAAVKLCLGVSPSRSGVFSAGNGPAMRSPLLGAALDDLAALRSYVRACTTITHTDPKAYHGALAAALAAWCAKRGLDTPAGFMETYRSTMASESGVEFNELMANVHRSVVAGESTEAFAEQLGCGQRVSGYVYRTVPVALHAWLSHPRDYRQAVQTVICCGGDTDTTAAIVGAVVGAGLGPTGIPRLWLDQIWEWPRPLEWMERLAQATARAIETGEPQPSPPVRPVSVVARNALFLAIVLAHVVRRLLPPY